MKDLADQIDATKIVAWTSQQHADAMLVHRAANEGEDPPKEDVPTADMMAALDHRVRATESVWVDFALWRSYGRRMQREWKMMTQQVTSAGEYTPYIIAGPPDYETWLQAWRVFSVCMMALGLAAKARLDLYGRWT